MYKVSFNTADEALAAPKANWAREKEPRGDAHRDNNVDTVPKHNDRVTRGKRGDRIKPASNRNILPLFRGED